MALRVARIWKTVPRAARELCGSAREQKNEGKKGKDCHARRRAMDADDADDADGVAIRIDARATCLGVDVTGTTAALGAPDGVHLVDLGSREAVPRLLAPAGPADSTLVAWSPVPARGSHLAAACPRAAHVWDTAAAGGHPVATLGSLHSPLSDLSWSHTESHLCATASMDGSVRAWDIRAPASPVFALPAGLASTPTSTSWSPAPGHILATAQGPAVSLWDVRKAGTQGQDDAHLQVLSEAHSRRVRRLAWATGRGARLMSCSEEGTVSLWDLVESRLAPAGALRLGSALREAAPAPDGGGVLTVSADASTRAAVRLWPHAAFLGAGSERRGVAPVRSWAAPAGGVEAVAWRVQPGAQPRAQIVAWSAGDRSLRLWGVTDSELEQCAAGGGGGGRGSTPDHRTAPVEAAQADARAATSTGPTPAPSVDDSRGSGATPSGPSSGPSGEVASPDASTSAAAATAAEESRVESPPRSAAEGPPLRTRYRKGGESHQAAPAGAPPQRQRRKHRRRHGRRRARQGASRGAGREDQGPSPQLQHSSIATLLPPTFAGATGAGGRGRNVPLPRLAGAHFCGNILVRFSNFVGMPLAVRGELMACRSYEDLISLELRYQAATNQETHVHHSTLHAPESAREGAAEEYARQGGQLGPAASPEAAFPELEGWAPPRDATGVVLGPGGPGDRFRRGDRRTGKTGRASRRGPSVHRQRRDASASPSASPSLSASPSSGGSSTSSASSPPSGPTSSRRQAVGPAPAVHGSQERSGASPARALLPRTDSSEYYRHYFSSQTALLPISHPAHLAADQRSGGGAGNVELREYREAKEEEAREADGEKEEEGEGEEDDEEEEDGGQGGGLFMWSQVVGGGDRAERPNPSPGLGATPGEGESAPLRSWKPPAGARDRAAGVDVAGALPVGWSSRRHASAQDLPSLGNRSAAPSKERAGSFSGLSSGDLPAHPRPTSRRDKRHSRADAVADEPVHAVARLAASMEEFGHRRRLVLPASARGNAAADASRQKRGTEPRPSQGQWRRPTRGRDTGGVSNSAGRDGAAAGRSRQNAVSDGALTGSDAPSEARAGGGGVGPRPQLHRSAGAEGEIVEENPTADVRDGDLAVTSLLPGDKEEGKEVEHEGSSPEESPWLEHALVWIIDVTDWLPTDEVLASRYLLPTRDPRQVMDAPQPRHPVATDSALAHCMRQQALHKMKAATAVARVRGAEPMGGGGPLVRGYPALGLTPDQEASLSALSALARDDFRAPGHVVGGTQPRAPWIASALQQPDGSWTRPSHACALGAGPGSRASLLWPDLEEKAPPSSALQAAAMDEPAEGAAKRGKPGAGACEAMGWEEDADGLWPWAPWSGPSAARARQTLRGRAALRGVPSAVCSFNALVSAARAAELAAHAQELSKAWAAAVLRYGAEGARDVAPPPPPPPPPGPAQARRQDSAPAVLTTGGDRDRCGGADLPVGAASGSRPAVGGLKSWRRAGVNRERLRALRERSLQAASFLRGRFSSEEWSDGGDATDTADSGLRPHRPEPAEVELLDTVEAPAQRQERQAARRARGLRSLPNAVGTLPPPPPAHRESSNGSTRFVRPDPEVEYAHALSSMRSAVHTDEEGDVETESEQAPGNGNSRGHAAASRGSLVGGGTATVPDRARRAARGEGADGPGTGWPFGSVGRGSGMAEGPASLPPLDRGPSSGREEGGSSHSGGPGGPLAHQASEETWETQSSAIVDRGGRMPLARQGFGPDLRRQAVSAVEESRRGSVAAQDGEEAPTLAVSPVAYGAEASFAAARAAVLRASVSQRLWEVLALSTDQRVYNPLAAASEHELSQSVRWSSHPLGRLLASRITRHALATGDAPLAAAISCALHVPGTRAVTAEEAARHEAQRRAHLRRHQRALRAAKLARTSGSAVDAAAAAAASGGVGATTPGPYAAMRDWAVDEASSSSGAGAAWRQEEDVSHRTEDADDEESGADEGLGEASARRGRRGASPLPPVSGAASRRPNRPGGRGDRRHSVQSGEPTGSAALWGRSGGERRRRGAANRLGPRPRGEVWDRPGTRSDDENGGDSGTQGESGSVANATQRQEDRAPEARTRARTFSSSANSPPSSPQLASRPAPSGPPRARLGVPATRQHTAPPLGGKLPQGISGPLPGAGPPRHPAIEESREGGHRVARGAEARAPISHVDDVVATAGGGHGGALAFGAGPASSHPLAAARGGPAHKAMRGANRLVRHLRHASSSALWSPSMAAGAAEAGRTAGDDSGAASPSHRRALSTNAGVQPPLLNAESAAEEAREGSGIGDADASEQSGAGWGRSPRSAQGRGARLRLHDQPQRHARAAVHLDPVYADANVTRGAADGACSPAAGAARSGGGGQRRRSSSPPTGSPSTPATAGGTPMGRSSRAGAGTGAITWVQELHSDGESAAGEGNALLPRARSRAQGHRVGSGAGGHRQAFTRPPSREKSLAWDRSPATTAASSAVSRGTVSPRNGAPELKSAGRVHAEKTLLDARNVAQRDAAKHAYAALLLRRGLLKRRALMLSSLGLAETDPSDAFQLSRAGAMAESGAGKVGADAHSTSPAVRAAARPVCAQWLGEVAGGEEGAPEPRLGTKTAGQGGARAPCALCGMGVQGLSLWCLRCGHGGHVECLTEWYGAYAAECPAGCGCACPKVCPAVAQALCQNP